MESSFPTHVGPYRLLHPLGRGGMGQVFAAVHEQTGQPVALKLLSPDTTGDPQRVPRFLQEARALARLQHPGVVRLFHCDLQGDIAFLAMEQLQGLTLRQWMQRQPGPAPFQTALALCEQIAAIMVDVHAERIVHRDLKPENVFLCPDPSLPLGHRLKLLDFGIAKLPPAPQGVLPTTEVHTQESAFIGTSTYMAPEQLRSAATVDSAADVYALGVLLFELLAGQTPFASDDPLDVISAKLNDEPPPLKQRVPTLPPALSAFISQMLAKEPAERPTMSRCRDMLGAPWEKAQETCPVPGLAPFTEARAELFFGRKTETQALHALLEEARAGRKKWVQLEGPSGVGKSSLLQAGVLPRLKESPSPGAPRWLVAPVRPSYEPLRNLARALAATYASTGRSSSSEELERTLARAPEALRDFVTSSTPEGCLLLLVLDPLEELFTLGTDESQQLEALLSSALSAPECPLRLLTSLRSDFFHRVEQLPSLARHLPSAARYPLLPMGEDALEQVIQGMAWHAGLRMDERLASRMVRDARGEGSRLPLLGHTLRELWTLSGGALLTLEHYERLGGVGGALARQAEELLHSLGPEGKECAKWLLLDLVQVGRGALDTRRPRSRQEMLAAAADHPHAEQVLLRLTGMRTGHESEETQGLRLIMPSGGEQPSAQRMELAHETLLHKVPSLVTWIQTERKRLEQQEDLEAAARTWEQAGCPADGLPTDAWLAQYREVLGSPFLKRRVSALAARFLQAAERLERRRAWIRRALVAAATLAGLVILVFAARAEQARQGAEQARQAAEQAQQRAEQERKRAEEGLRQLIAEADELVGDLDWELSRLPYTLEGRKQMLRGFQARLEALQVWEGQRPEFRLASIRFRQRLADLSFHDESLADADRLLLEALELLRTGLTQQPGDQELQKQLALNLSKRGKVALARGHREEAYGHFTQALQLLDDPSVRRGWNEEDFLRTRAVSLAELAEVESALGHLERASALYTEALAVQSRNGGAYNQYVLASTLGDLSEVLRKQGDTRGAEEHLQRALQLGRACVQSTPGNQLYRWVLARTLVKLGALQAAQRQPAAAVSYREASSLGESLHAVESSNKRYALVWIQARLGLGQNAEACKVVRELLHQDREDARFQLPQCQGTQEEK